MRKKTLNPHDIPAAKSSRLDFLLQNFACFISILFLLATLLPFSFLFPVARQSVNQHVGFIALYFAHIIFLIWLMCIYLRKAFSERSPEFFALLAYTAIAVGLTHYHVTSWGFSAEIYIWGLGIQPIIFGIFLPSIFQKKTADIFIKAMVVFMAMISATALIFYFTGKSTFFDIELLNNGYKKENFERLGLFSNRNHEGSFFMWVPATSLYLYFVSIKNRWLWLVTFCVTSLHVWMTFSRGVSLGLLISLIPAMFLLSRRSLVFLILGAVMIISATFMKEGFVYYKYVETAFEFRDRELYWRECLTFLMTGKNLLIGSGYLGFWPLTFRPHNLILTQLVYYGIFGTVAYFAAITLFFRKALGANPKICSPRQPESLLFFMLCGVLMTEMFGDNISTSLFFSASYFWFFLGVVASKSYFQRVR